MRDIYKLNEKERNFRILRPGRDYLQPALTRSLRRPTERGTAETYDTDDHLAPDGRVMDSMLSEHVCEGLLEGYLLTGRHGFFNSYEAFIRIVDSMFSQHAKWLKVCNQLPWRAGHRQSLNYVLAIATYGSRTTTASRIRTPASLTMSRTRRPTSCASTCPRMQTACSAASTTASAASNYVNVIVASQAPASPVADHGAGRQALHPGHRHLAVGVSTDEGEEPDIVMACCGDTPTLETLAAVTILREAFPELQASASSTSLT